MSLDALSTSPLLSLIGWTAISAFTLGAAAAALVRLIEAAAPRLAPRWAHRLVLSLYALSLAAAIVVAAIPRRPPTSPTIVPTLPLAGAVLPVPPGPSLLTAVTAGARPLDGAGVFVALLGLVSLALALFACGRLCRSLVAIRRLRRSAVCVSDLSILAIVENVAGRLGIRRRVALRESSAVDTAITGGWLRPFILLPPGLREELGSEIEPVFAHELAHVRRHDFAVAVCQAVVDAATMLSPGHRWLSVEASRLREQACDDVVVTLGVEPIRYARALEALGKWSRGQAVSRVVCAANRNLASRVLRLLEGPRTPTALTVVSAVGLLLSSALAATLVAAAAPGLPMPLTIGHDPTKAPELLSGPDARGLAESHPGRSVVTYWFDGQLRAPYRIVGMTVGSDAVPTNVQNIYPKRIVGLALGLVARRIPSLSPDDLFVMRSKPIEITIDPGRSASGSFTFAPIAKTPVMTWEQGEAKYYPAYAKFEDGTEWSAPPPSFPPPLTIPLELISPQAPTSSSPADRISTCYDAEGKQTSEGGLAAIRENPNRWVQCTNGRWVEVPAIAPPADEFELIGRQ